MRSSVRLSCKVASLVLLLLVMALPSVAQLEKQSPECTKRQMALWSAAKSHCMRQGLPYTNKVSVSDISFYLRDNTTGYGSCPSGGAYSAFSLEDGPVCPNGHQIPATVREEFMFSLSGPTNHQQMIAFLTSSNATWRILALQHLQGAVAVRLLSEQDARDFLKKAALSDDSTDVRIAALTEVQRWQDWRAELLATSFLEDDNREVRKQAERLVHDMLDQDMRRLQSPKKAGSLSGTSENLKADKR